MRSPPQRTPHFEVTARLSSNGHPALGLADGAIGIFNRAKTPAAFVMLRHL
jgi:hypothetical protein